MNIIVIIILMNIFTILVLSRFLVQISSLQTNLFMRHTNLIYETALYKLLNLAFYLENIIWLISGGLSLKRLEAGFQFLVRD